MSAEKILLADAENNIRVVFSKCLADAGYSVTTVPDGRSVLQAMENDTYPVVILDISLPDIDGLEVLRQIKAVAPMQRVIIVTDHGTIETAVEAMRRGAADYLQKPVTPEELQRAISRNLAPVNSQEIKAEETFEGYITEARILLEQRKLAAALPVIHRAIQLESGRPEGFNLLGALDELHGDQEAARRMYRVALTIDATYTPASFNLNRLCRWKTISGINLGDRPEKELTLQDLIV